MGALLVIEWILFPGEEVDAIVEVFLVLLRLTIIGGSNLRDELPQVGHALRWILHHAQYGIGYSPKDSDPIPHCFGIIL